MKEAARLFLWFFFGLIRVLIGLGLAGFSGFMLWVTLIFKLVPPFPLWFFFFGIFLGAFIMMTEFFPKGIPPTKEGDKGKFYRPTNDGV
ncbi:MAG: hypothetical protein WAZ96_05505 [Candidatus Moraniibacteriota bacterium]